MNLHLRRLIPAALAALLVVSPMETAFAYPYDIDDYDQIAGDLDLSIPQKLAFTRPSESFTTSASAYYLTGNSNPTQDLYLNGELVGSRGNYGSFGVYVALEPGANLFTLEQNGQQVSVTITRGTPPQVVTTTKVMTAIYPSYDVGVNAGDEITLSCTAPAGATVTAKVSGVTVGLNQRAVAQQGVPAVFNGTITAGDVGGTQNLGAVVYTMQYNGATTTYTSAGELYVAGSNTQLTVQVKDPSATVFDKSTTASVFLATAKKGAVDTVVEMKNEGSSPMYRLKMGGWILKSAVQPMISAPSSRAQVNGVSFRQGDKGERFVLNTDGAPIFSAYQDSSRLHIRFYNTSGVGSFPVGESSLYNDYTVTQEGSDTVVDLMLAPGKTLWGYVVEYANGEVRIYSKYKPTLSGGTQPLAGVTVMLDPGHGGEDPGALGIARLTGATEKEINLATATAVRRRLEGLGATVSMTRTGDVNPNLNQRLQYTQEQDADLFIALHCNATAANVDGVKPNGIEAYYYESIGKPLATALTQNIASATGRNNRGAKYSNFKVTLNSYAPSVLVEMAFLTNPWDYDNLRSKEAMYNTANAVADSVISVLNN